MRKGIFTKVTKVTKKIHELFSLQIVELRDNFLSTFEEAFIRLKAVVNKKGYGRETSCQVLNVVVARTDTNIR